jgi:hypothetical protein
MFNVGPEVGLDVGFEVLGLFELLFGWYGVPSSTVGWKRILMCLWRDAEMYCTSSRTPHGSFPFLLRWIHSLKLQNYFTALLYIDQIIGLCELSSVYCLIMVITLRTIGFWFVPSHFLLLAFFNLTVIYLSIRSRIPRRHRLVRSFVACVGRIVKHWIPG